MGTLQNHLCSVHLLKPRLPFSAVGVEAGQTTSAVYLLTCLVVHTCILRRPKSEKNNAKNGQSCPATPRCVRPVPRSQFSPLVPWDARPGCKLVDAALLPPSNAAVSLSASICIRFPNSSPILRPPFPLLCPRNPPTPGSYVRSLFANLHSFTYAPSPPLRAFHYMPIALSTQIHHTHVPFRQFGVQESSATLVTARLEAGSLGALLPGRGHNNLAVMHFRSFQTFRAAETVS